MSALDRISIAKKLVLLAGVPVVGAILLASLIVHEARQRAEGAAALGSIEDVARMSVYIGDVLHSIQGERASSARAEGTAAHSELDALLLGDAPATTGGGNVNQARVALRRAKTDDALRTLETFLAGRDLARLPPRLGRELDGARRRLAMLHDFRTRLDAENVPLQDVLDFYGPAAESLVQATAALTQLSDDGELLRNISALVALLELSERASREHALLGFVFEARQFPPGAFKTLVTLVTEEDTYADVFRTHAATDQAARYHAMSDDSEVQTAAALRREALAVTEDTLDIDPERWFNAQSSRLDRFGEIERSIILRVGAAAASKSSEIRSAFRTSTILVVLVLGSSTTLAFWITSRIRKSVGELSSAAARVRETKDYAIRAVKTSADEIGVLAEAFNEMLAGIEERDRELAAHRENLEAMVEERTAQLANRNAAMRIVLDNVEQGLVTVGLEGKLASERSAAFENWFGKIPPDAKFYDVIGEGNERLAQMLELGWEMVVEDFIPADVALAQLPKRMERDGRHYALGFRPIMDNGKISGSLLIVSDITAEVEARAEQERQKEQIAIFERISQDRAGFVEFFDETSELVQQVCKAKVASVHEAMVLTHTIKGNAGQYGASTVAKIAHDLETTIVDSGQMPDAAALAPLSEAWDALGARVRDLLGQVRGRLELYPGDIDELFALAERSGSPPPLLKAIERLKREPVAVRFARMTDQINRLAVRFQKPAPNVISRHNGVRLPASRFAGFWASFVHVLRNVMDHGLESAEMRKQAGKSEQGNIVLTARLTESNIVLEIADDGQGINWAKVAGKAKSLGLPTRNQEDLERALLGGGVTTKDEVSDVSGRGVGMSAVAERCRALGGYVRIASAPGQGTKLTFVIPARGNETSLSPGAPSVPPSAVLGGQKADGL